MDARQKTENLSRVFLGADLLVPNPENPNEMGDAEFNMLYDNIAQVGLTDPILVRPHPDIEGKYKVIGGHHRLEVAKLHGIEDIPCTIITDPTFDDDAEKFQVVRHNVIHGKMSPTKFMKMYESLAGKYGQEVLQEMFGFTDAEEFKKLIKNTAKTLPKEMQHSFTQAAQEIKTIDGLSALLNKMFSTHGDTLDSGYMIVDFGGKESVWLRMSTKDKQNFDKIALECKNASVSVYALFSSLFSELSKGNSKSVAQMLGALPKLPIGE